MRLRQIEIFYHVYRTGSISMAARDLNVSQPSVSKVLRHAEDQLGIELFMRIKGRLVPTQAAHELYAEVEEIYDRLSTFSRSLENIGKRRGGHLRLGVLPSLSLSLAPDLVARLRDADKAMTFELTTTHSAEMPRMLLEKACDLCIGFEALEDERFATTRIGEGQMVLVSAKPLALDGNAIDAGVLDGADFIGMQDSGPLGELVTSALASRDINPVEIVSAHTYHVALSLVRKRVGIAITDQFTAYSHLGAGLHRYVLGDLPRFPIHVSALTDHPDGHLIELGLAKAKAVIRHLQTGIASLQLPEA